MDLNTYIADTTRRKDLAEKLQRNPVYLWQIATGRRRASTDLAQAIERATAELGPETVTKESLRPDVWRSQDAA
jgi:DNA-binding transcriptional regulator YdaS (Cro superfamily)